jgi:hypothetical protein
MDSLRNPGPVRRDPPHCKPVSNGIVSVNPELRLSINAKTVEHDPCHPHGSIATLAGCLPWLHHYNDNKYHNVNLPCREIFSRQGAAGGGFPDANITMWRAR